MFYNSVFAMKIVDLLSNFKGCLILCLTFLHTQSNIVTLPARLSKFVIFFLVFYQFSVFFFRHRFYFQFCFRGWLPKFSICCTLQLLYHRFVPMELLCLDYFLNCEKLQLSLACNKSFWLMEMLNSLLIGNADQKPLCQEHPNPLELRVAPVT